MSKYGISQEGVDALNQLAQDLYTLGSDIEQSGNKLKTSVSGLGDQLGTYEEKINELVEQVNNTQMKSREPLVQLSVKAKDMANRISELISSGI